MQGGYFRGERGIRYRHVVIRGAKRKTKYLLSDWGKNLKTAPSPLRTKFSV